MIAGQGPAGAESALLVLKGSLLGLAAAHALGIVHRDYKPENVLVDAQGTSRLTDFGIAARQGGSAPVGGTPFYMAPEQWDGTPATPAADIYAATAVFFECLTGLTPFSGGMAQLAAQHAAAAVPVELVDEPLRELIARGMAKDPAARPPSATDLVSELEATATAAYGADWESRGRLQLAGRAAALLLLLAHGQAAAAASGTGTGTVTTTLSHARRAAGLARRALSAGHGAGAAVTAAAAATVITVALLPAAHKSPAPAPAAFTLNGDIAAMTATSDNDVWAVGCRLGNGGLRNTCTKTLIVHFNGRTWAQVPSPSPGAAAGLTAVSAGPVGSAWAVGDTQATTNGNSMPLILHWNGRTWTQVSSPPGAVSTADSVSIVDGVAVASAGNAWAIGCVPNKSSTACAFSMVHWNGTNWTRVQTPGVLSYVDAYALSATDAVAIAYRKDGKIVLLHWNGTTWS
jgi:hypothetical protein